MIFAGLEYLEVRVQWVQGHRFWDRKMVKLFFRTAF